jgi:hypothetical protein
VFSFHFFLSILAEVNGNRHQADQLHVLESLRRIQTIASEHSLKFPRSKLRRDAFLLVIIGLVVCGLSIAVFAFT